MIRKIPALPERIRPMGTWWHAQSQTVRDGVLAAVFAVLAFTPGVAEEGVILGGDARRPVDLLGLGLLLAQCLPLVIRRSRPTWCLGIVGAAFAAHELLGYPPTFASEGLFVALYTVAAYEERFRRTAAVVGTVAYALLAVALHFQGSPERPVGFVTFYVIVLVGCWVIVGNWMRGRTRREAERRRLAAEAAIRQERARIARELHDVVTHHVTAMVVQADATQFSAADSPEQVVGDLATISETGRRTLAELRYFLGVLDPVPEAAPAPTIDRLQDLVEQIRSAGQPVELSEVGERRPMTHGAELTAYRVVQEALTNALKHAAGRRTVVRVHHDKDVVDIEVSTDGPGGASGTRDGRGLSGLRERVGVVGGELRAGGRPDGSFTVHARIPTGSEQ